MAELPTAAQITDLVSLLAPGLIISTIRIRVVTGSVPDLKDRILSYGLISTGYFAAITPLFHVQQGILLSHWVWSFLQYFIVPVVVGIGLAYIYQSQLSYWLAEKGKLHLAHHLPASWDYAFQNRTDNTYVLVTLQDGSQIGGKWARGSFASSSKDERDLLISEMWTVSEPDEAWTPFIPRRSILISQKEIRYIEFIGGQK